METRHELEYINFINLLNDQELSFSCFNKITLLYKPKSTHILLTCLI